MPPAVLSPWTLLAAGLGTLIVIGWQVAAPPGRRLAAVGPLVGLASLSTLAIGLLAAAAAASPGNAAAATLAVSLLPAAAGLAGLLLARLQTPAPALPKAPSAPSRPVSAAERPPDAPSATPAKDSDWAVAVQQLALAQREQAERIEDVLAPLVPAIQVAGESSQALREEVGRLGQEQAELRGLLSAWREQQSPVLEVLGEVGGKLQGITGDVAQLMRLVVANQQLAVDGLQAACGELTAAGQSLQHAAAEWGGLVRSGLADSREFSRQAIDALLAGLERSPEELTGLPADAREAAAEAEAMAARLHAASTELTAVADGLQTQFDTLANRLAEQLQTAVESVDATALAGLRESLDALQTTTTTLATSLGKLDPAFGSLAQLGSLTEALSALRATLESRAAASGRRWPARLLGGLVLLYVLATLGLSAGLFGRG